MGVSKQDKASGYMYCVHRGRSAEVLVCLPGMTPELEVWDAVLPV